MTSPPPESTPAFDADVIVIGGGAAALTASQLAASLGRRVLLVEARQMGGECLNTGCVPSKTLLRLAHQVHAARRSARLGMQIAGLPDWAVIRSELERVRAQLAQVDSPQALAKVGVQVIHGQAQFTGERTIQVTGAAGQHSLRARAFVLATGAQVSIPPIPGLDGVPYLTHETIFELPQRPARLAVLGGGPVGAELAQAFVRLGSAVTLIESSDRLLFREEPEASRAVLQALRADGVEVNLQASVQRVTAGMAGVELHLAGEPEPVKVSHLLIATGKRPTVGGLGLECIGAAFDERGLTVRADMRSVSCPYLWGAGDVVGDPMFTHGATERGTLAGLGAAGWWGRLAGQLRAPAGRVEGIPAVTFTEPEVARWGLTEQQARARWGKRVAVYDYRYDQLDRAVTDGEQGFVKLMVRRGVLGSPLGLRVVGVQVVGTHAGELVQALSLPSRLGVHPLRLALLPQAYPTYSEAVRHVMLGLFVQGHAFARRRTPRTQGRGPSAKSRSVE